MDSSVLKQISQGYSVTRKCILVSVYFALMLDNLLLTAVVPILPHLVRHQHDSKSNSSLNFLQSSAEHFQRTFHDDNSENQQLGTLLSLKAIVQLAANPLVAFISQKRGFNLPLLFGTLNIILCSLLFAFGTTYRVLATARALQGISSACFTIAGLGLVASNYKEEMKRSSALGQALGGGAVGVLLGYPIGGFLYQLSGKILPFLIITAMACLLLVILCFTLPFLAAPSEETVLCPNPDLNQEVYDRGDRRLLLAVAVGAIFLSTSVMALLEPCLPLWLLRTMKPERWQLGAVFIPDSCGYLLTTHFLGGFAYRFGRWKVAILSMLLLGICCCLIPLVPSIIYLSIPHLGIGAGIGSVDAALVPLLATLADSIADDTNPSVSNTATYGRTFAIGQTAVGLAYCFGPLIGGMLVESVGFPKLMLSLGVVNLLYTPLIIMLRPSVPSPSVQRTQMSMLVLKQRILQSKTPTYQYTRFHNQPIDES